MQKRSRFISLALVAISVFMTSATSLAASAATPASSTTTSKSVGNGLKVSPVRTDLTINPGETQSIAINVQNVTSVGATFQAVINDFVAGNNEDGQPALLLDSTKFAPSHSLKRFIADIPNVTIAAGETKTVKAVITVPKDAAGGGYFGAVRFAPATDGSTNKNVTLSASVGSLILVKVPGDIKDDLRITSFDVRRGADSKTASSFFTSNKSLYGVVRFENQGNIQEQPFGKLQLKKGNKVLASSEINNTDPKGNVLPDSVRRFNIPLDKVGSWGKYTIEGNFGYGSKGQLLSATSTFYVLPVALIITLIVLLIVIIGLIIWLPRAIKRYNQKIIRRSGRR